MKLVAYVDESGRHDKTGQQKGSGQIVVAGWLDWRENWADFCVKWKAVLDDYGAPYFHFAEWADASAVARNKHAPSSAFGTNPYRNWNLDKLDSFLYALADIAGSGRKIILGGFVSTRDFSEAKNHVPYSHFVPNHGDPYSQCLTGFFDRFSSDVQSEWPYWTEKVFFFFDQNDDEIWNRSVLDAFTRAKKKDARIAELTFANMREYPHLPLQAADMVAYRIHQQAGNFVDSNADFRASELDKRLWKQPMLRAMRADPHGSLMDYLSLLPLRVGNFSWRKENGSDRR